MPLGTRGSPRAPGYGKCGHGRPRTTKKWIYNTALRCALNISGRMQTSSPRAYAIEAAPYIKQLRTLRSTWENS
ncbi:hypothetical protein Y032_0037g3524 [Ancylostoma ceylanicum]|uniref:Uncharacterized protein n=1 Tax=Ancylostoma ceylanicum TaxID=53326 RepID=A0A016ULP2_9BILA|nr:hypothetical protein Y032_0037g3524 [Ancylostoma ceylanicum]